MSKLSEFFKMVWDILVELFAVSTWEDFKKKGWLPVVVATLYTIWDILTSPLGPMLFVNFLAVFAVTLFIAERLQTRRLLKKRERGELAAPEELAEMSALRTKLAAMEDVHPRLVDEPVLITRRLTAQQQLASYGGQNRQYRPNVAFFLLLRIKNVPESTNSLAIARSMYAETSYFGSQWGDELFPAVTGAWVTPDSETICGTIGGISSECPDLRPHQDAAYLGIAIGYFGSSNQECGALTASSPRYLNWIDLEALLNNRVSDDIINVKVTLGCHGFQTTSYYILKMNEAEAIFSLTPTSHIQHIAVRVR